tara:strand:- start:201 stop:386 length:186 start_codon:yes stop_codon:yes gene_type:complete
MATTKKNKQVSGKDAIGTKEKAFKDVFLEETTKVRVKIGTIEKTVSDLTIAVNKIKNRLGI